MKFRISEVSKYKKLVTAICGIPSARKQLNGIEQCIEIKAINSEQGGGIIEVSTVDLTSHSIKLVMQAEVLEPGRQIVLSSKLKSLTSRLNPNYGLSVESKNNLLSYETKPFGSIADSQYFVQDSLMSQSFFEERNWDTVCGDLGLFLDLVPYICTNTYSDKEVYLTTRNGFINTYVQFSETSYIKYTAVTNTKLEVEDFRAAIKPGLLKIILLLSEKDSLETISLDYCKQNALVKFSSSLGVVILACDMSFNKMIAVVNTVIEAAPESKVNLAHESLLGSLNFKSYATTETDIVTIGFDREIGKFNLNINSDTKPTTLAATEKGTFSQTTLSVGHLNKAIKAMGSAKNKILAVGDIDICLKKVPVVNATPIKAIHLKPDVPMDVTTDIIMYEASC